MAVRTLKPGTMPLPDLEKPMGVGYRDNQFISLVILPILTALGHLAPSIGAARAMVGYWYLDWPVLIATSTITTFIDAYDKYRDIPKQERPSHLKTASFLVPLLGSTFVSSYILGLHTAFRLHRWLIFGFVYGNPLIPAYSFETGKWRLVKPKVVFAVFKSASVALVMANVDADIGASHACMAHDWECRWDNLGIGSEVYWQSFALAFLYNWVRETMCDIRDRVEDSAEGVPTLPVTVGRKTALAMLVIGTFLTEQAIFSGMMQSDFRAFVGWDSVARQVVTLLGCWVVFDRPREDKWAWSFVAFCGLFPATWAQARL